MEKIRVLIAEDVDILREDYQEVLSESGNISVEGTAASGKEIVEMADNIECDVILMDIEMEDIDTGIKAAEIIHRRKPDIKIVFMTAHENDEIITGAMSTGAVDYIIKGCSDEEVIERVIKAYNGETSLNPKVSETIIEEYKRLRRSEYSLLFFIHNVAVLTPAEHDLLKLLLKNKKIKEIAEIRSVEQVTVKTQIKGLLRKFGCSRSREIVNMIREMGLERLFLEK